MRRFCAANGSVLAAERAASPVEAGLSPTNTPIAIPARNAVRTASAREIRKIFMVATLDRASFGGISIFGRLESSASLQRGALFRKSAVFEILAAGMLQIEIVTLSGQ